MSENVEPVEKVKVESLTPQSRRVNVTVKVSSKNPVREIVSRRDGSNHRVTEALCGDETGTILLTLWDADIEKVNEGDTVDVGNGYVSLFQGSMRLNIGRFGTLEPSKTVIENVKTDNNLSDKHYEEENRGYQSFRRYPSSGGYGDRGGGGYGGRSGGYGGGRGGYGDRGGRRDFRGRRDDR